MEAGVITTWYLGAAVVVITTTTTSGTSEVVMGGIGLKAYPVTTGAGNPQFSAGLEW